MLGECSPALGVVLWQALRDVLLWNTVDPGDRANLFWPARSAEAEWVSQAELDAPEIAGSLRDLRTFMENPESAKPEHVAEVCARVWQWAEVRGMRETALEFAEAAARVDFQASSRSYTAGRLCRSAAEYERGILWFRRASRLARRAGPPSEIDFANAHLGWGHLEHDRGNLPQAEVHFWKACRAALRHGRHSLAAAAYHNLLILSVDAERPDDAAVFALKAIHLHPAKHPRLPVLAFDVGFLWLSKGHFSAALYLFNKVLPWIVSAPERSLALALFARSAAAVRDRIRFERAVGEVMKLAQGNNERADAALFHLAEGARSFEQWDRAKELAEQAREFARFRRNGVVLPLTERLIGEIAERRLGDVDIVPDEGGFVDRVTSKVMAKLRKQPAPEPRDPGAGLFPERYPLD
jgi:tetratricopeptide (TPR) repeat protein